MAKEKAVTNTGPILHLSEISCEKSLKIFSSMFCTLSVQQELAKYLDGHKTTFLETKNLAPKYKKMSEIIHVEFEIGPTEAEAIALCKQTATRLFLTDDLEARIVSKKFGIKPVGSVGIILRAFRENVFSQAEAIKMLEALQDVSSLFITPDLISNAIEEAKKFGAKRTKTR